MNEEFDCIYDYKITKIRKKIISFCIDSNNITRTNTNKLTFIEYHSTIKLWLLNSHQEINSQKMIK